MNNKTDTGIRIMIVGEDLPGAAIAKVFDAIGMFVTHVTVNEGRLAHQQNRETYEEDISTVLLRPRFDELQEIGIYIRECESRLDKYAKDWHMYYAPKVQEKKVSQIKHHQYKKI